MKTYLLPKLTCHLVQKKQEKTFILQQDSTDDSQVSRHYNWVPLKMKAIQISSPLKWKI